ncbi:zinc finger MYM-type protein 5-like [Camellia sinensis]|uniref:zinc finger MYM-type protein 5-like n=1 Tax=Camellia sinensis TaxID=4442 RepID=UPI0010363DC7|nr:zinc finger MYM-type protein 5-like [Camellia sinensis]
MEMMILTLAQSSILIAPPMETVPLSPLRGRGRRGPFKLDAIGADFYLDVEEPIECLNENDNEELVNGKATESEDFNVEYGPLNINDPSNWDKIDQNFKDLLVERGPIRSNVVNFPRDDNDRHFSSTYYIRNLSNEEKQDRKWLVYSDASNKVFSFCCKLFKEDGNKT